MHCIGLTAAEIKVNLSKTANLEKFAKMVNAKNNVLQKQKENAKAVK